MKIRWDKFPTAQEVFVWNWTEVPVSLTFHLKLERDSSKVQSFCPQGDSRFTTSNGLFEIVQLGFIWCILCVMCDQRPRLAVLRALQGVNKGESTKEMESCLKQRHCSLELTLMQEVAASHNLLGGFLVWILFSFFYVWTLFSLFASNFALVFSSICWVSSIPSNVFFWDSEEA